MLIKQLNTQQQILNLLTKTRVDVLIQWFDVWKMGQFYLSSEDRLLVIETHARMLI